MVSVLRGLPEEAGATDTTGAATILAASAILDRRADARKAVVRHLLRTAAVLLLLVGLATAFGKLLLGRPAYRPLDLEFVQVSPNDEPDTEIPLEEIFGPTTPLLSANGGHGGERSNR